MKGIKVSCGFLKLKWLFHLVWCVWCVPLLKWFCFKNSLFLRDFFFIFHLIRRIINFLIRNVLLALIILKRGSTSFFYLTFSTIYFASCVSNSTKIIQFSMTKFWSLCWYYRFKKFLSSINIAHGFVCLLVDSPLWLSLLNLWFGHNIYKTTNKQPTRKA